MHSDDHHDVDCDDVACDDDDCDVVVGDDESEDGDEQHSHLPLEGQPCNGGGGHSLSSPLNSSSFLLFCLLPPLPPLPPRLPDLWTSPALPRFATGDRLITSPG